ncbi:MAG: 1-acyl-sn-glycerol-3-phosphate acyltransferase [Clostridiales bacterium]|nr:1-acyl-sn-glycerol-3-phosphate acyltransferase [Clostridiales bacterium]
MIAGEGMYFFLVRILSVVARLIYPIRIYGVQNIPKSGKVILCSNHKSVIDPFLLAKKCPRHIYYMAKSELFTDHGKLARWFLNKMGAFPVHRGTGDTESVHSALQLLLRGELVGIFPQGGCVTDSDTSFQPKAGAVLIAAKAQADILPACIYSKGKIRPFHRITVRYGEVIPFEALQITGSSSRECRVGAKKVADQICSLLGEKH